MKEEKMTLAEFVSELRSSGIDLRSRNAQVEFEKFEVMGLRPTHECQTKVELHRHLTELQLDPDSALFNSIWRVNSALPLRKFN